MYESAAPVYDAGVGNGSAYKGTDDVSELRRRVQYLEERMTHSEPAGAGLSSKSLAEAVGTTPSSHASVVANPAPLGLFAFGLTTAMLSAGYARWTEAETTVNWVIGFALFYGGLIQLLAGMWEIWRNNMFGGVALSSYGGFWMGFAIVEILSMSHVIGALPPHGEQLFLALWGCFTFLLFILSFGINAALVILFLLLSCTFFLLAGGVGVGTHLSVHANSAKAGGYFGVATAAVAWYIAFAELVNEVFRRKILPLGVFNIRTTEQTLPTNFARPDTL